MTHLAVNSPWYLVLMLLAPAMWWASFRSLSGLGTYRRLFALALRTSVLLFIVGALAEVQFLRISDRMTVIYLLDQSESIPQAQRDAMVQYVRAEVSRHRQDGKRDRAAVIVFGREANIEVPPVDDDLPIAGRLESTFDLKPDATNLAQALKLAQATFPEDSSRRIVVVSDGNENVGDARSIAQVMAEDGIGVDVVPIRLNNRAEIEVDKIALPADIRKSQPFEATVVVNNLAQPVEGDAGLVGGTLKVVRRQGRNTETLTETPVELAPGKNVYRFRNEIDEPDFYEYQALFVPDDPGRDDVLAQNNRATAFTQVLGAGHILLIEDWENAGEFDHLVGRLRSQNLQVTVMRSDELFGSLGELQRYDCVILANVPRTSGDVDNVTNFSDEQISMLVHNTQKLGCGLIMLGGPNSFGAGGWTNSELEKAMPVDFQIHNAKVVPVGALAMVMHASELANGNYWQKKISEEALNVLGPHDYCGVIHWEGREEWLWQKPDGLVRVGANKRQMMARLSRMTPGDMPDFDPALKMALSSFAKIQDAAVKHMIVISDGDPSPPSMSVLQAFKSMGVKVSTVAVGTHGPAGSFTLQRVAQTTGGKYYVVKSAKALPRIFQKETMRVARPLVKEQPGIPTAIKFRHEILQGIDSVPPIDGFVLTSLKENNLVELALVASMEGTPEKNTTVMAAWSYGAGRTAVVTTDAGKRWASGWSSWENYDRFYSQLLRWAMRPTGDQGKFSVATQLQDGKVHVVVTALDKDDELLNFLDMAADLLRPDMDSEGVRMKQVAPGRYVGEFDAAAPGSYFLSINPGPGYGLLRTGMSVPYSAEYRDRETNDQLLLSLAELQPRGGAAGKLIDGELAPGQIEPLLEVSTFRRDLARAVSSRDIWPLLVMLAGCVFFADVFVRRVAVSFEWVSPLLARLRRRLFGGEEVVVADERMERLRSRKAAISDSIDLRRAATRFEPLADQPEVDIELLREATQTDLATPRKESATAGLSPSEADEEDYTSRLKKAKQQALQGRQKRSTPDPPPPPGQS